MAASRDVTIAVGLDTAPRSAHPSQVQRQLETEGSQRKDRPTTRDLCLTAMVEAAMFVAIPGGCVMGVARRVTSGEIVKHKVLKFFQRHFFQRHLLLNFFVLCN